MLKRLVLLAALVASAAVPAPSFAAPKGVVLIIMSKARQLPLKDGKLYNNAGTYLGEVAAPVKALVEAGYTPVFASPDGIAPKIDPFSEQEFFFKGGAAEATEAKSLMGGMEGFKHPRKLAEV